MIATVYFSRIPDDKRQDMAMLNKSFDLLMIGMTDFKEPDVVQRLIEAAAQAGIYEPAARFDCESDNPDHIWPVLQNIDDNWRDRGGPECLTEFPRSMMVGDVILAENGRCWVTANIGFIDCDGKAFKEALPK